MKTKFAIVTIFSLFFGHVYSQQIQEPCISNEILKENLLKYPDLINQINLLESETNDYQSNIDGAKSNSAVRVIPVVFHIIHQYGNENISREQCLDQIRVLNEDFRRLNADTNNTPVPFRPIAADTQIEFKIAQKDPNGNCTDGVNRIYSGMTIAARDNVKSLSYWPRDKYLNIWVVKYITGSGTSTGFVVGFAQFPGGGQATTDGIVVRHDYLGNIGTAAGERGRTATHEVGHWLNLRHIWGDADCGNDGVSDTPTQQDANQSNCPTFPHVTCNNGPNGDMFTNYMDYTNASCQNIFTDGQSARMNAALSSTTSGRSTLWSATNISTTGVNNTPVLCKPKADFTPHLATYICEGGSISMADKSYGADVTSRVWYFPGGTPSTSTALNPTITYSTPGTYNVSIKVMNASGSDSITKTGVVVVMPLTAAYQFPYTEGFENLNTFSNDWSVINFEPSSAGFTRTASAAASGTYSCRLSVLSNSLDYDMDELISPSIDLTAYDVPKLRFKNAYAQTTTALATDNKLAVFISTNCGKTWTQLIVYAGTSLATSTATSSNFTPSSASQWLERTITLNNYKQNSNVRFKFRFTGSASGNNLFLDDIFIDGNSTLGIDDFNSNFFDFKILPNPTNSVSNIDFKLAESSNIELLVLDALGKIVVQNNYGKLSEGNHNFSLTQSQNQISKGVYFVKLISNKNQLVRKWVVN